MQDLTPGVVRAWVGVHRARRAARRVLRREPPPLRDLVGRLAPGRSFADIGCMWRVDGAIAFAAEEAGATSVTGLDYMDPTERFEAERARRGSAVRFVQGDLHDPAVLAQVGTHDVVWCSGVLYHAPHPLLTLERLRSITAETLMLGSATIPEVPGVPQACLFLPGLSDARRAAFRGAWIGTPMGVATSFDAQEGYANWWWAITPSALDAMLRASGFEPVETVRHPFYTAVVARVRR